MQDKFLKFCNLRCVSHLSLSVHEIVASGELLELAFNNSFKKKKLYIYRRHIVLDIANIMLINLSQFLVMVGNLLVDRRVISQSQLIVVHGTLPHRP